MAVHVTLRAVAGGANANMRPWSPPTPVDLAPVPSAMGNFALEDEYPRLADVPNYKIVVGTGRTWDMREAPAFCSFAERIDATCSTAHHRSVEPPRADVRTWHQDRVPLPAGRRHR